MKARLHLRQLGKEMEQEAGQDMSSCHGKDPLQQRDTMLEFLTEKNMSTAL